MPSPVNLSSFLHWLRQWFAIFLAWLAAGGIATLLTLGIKYWPKRKQPSEIHKTDAEARLINARAAAVELRTTKNGMDMIEDLGQMAGTALMRVAELEKESVLDKAKIARLENENTALNRQLAIIQAAEKVRQNTGN